MRREDELDKMKNSQIADKLLEMEMDNMTAMEKGDLDAALTGQAKEIAKAAGGKYHYIPKGGGAAITNVASQAIADMKG